jgi:hypothetical protein
MSPCVTWFATQSRCISPRSVVRASDHCQHRQFYRPVAGFTDSEVVVGLGPCEATSRFIAPPPWSSRTARCMIF